MTDSPITPTSAAENVIGNLISNLMLSNRLLQWTLQGLQLVAWTDEEKDQVETHRQQQPLAHVIALHDAMVARDYNAAVTLADSISVTLSTFSSHLTMFKNDDKISQLPILPMLEGLLNSLQSDVALVKSRAEHPSSIDTVLDVSMLADLESPSIYLKAEGCEDLLLDLRLSDDTRPADAPGSDHRLNYTIFRTGTRISPFLREQLGSPRAVIFGLYGQGPLAAGHCFIVPLPAIVGSDINLKLSKEFIIPNFSDHHAPSDSHSGDFLNAHYQLQTGLELLVRMSYVIVEGETDKGERYFEPHINFTAGADNAVLFNHARGGLMHRELTAASQAFRNFMPMGLIYDRRRDDD